MRIIAPHIVKCFVSDGSPQPCIGIGMNASLLVRRLLARLQLSRRRHPGPKLTPSCMFIAHTAHAARATHALI